MKKEYEILFDYKPPVEIKESTKRLIEACFGFDAAIDRLTVKGDLKMTKEKKNSAFMKPVGVSDALAEIVGKGPMARTEVTKKLWEYIKKHELQDKKNKRNINPDQKLEKVLGSKDSIDMFQMTSKVAKHLKDLEPAKNAR